VILADEIKENLTVDALQYFDDKGVKTLCATLRKPGGTIAGVVPAGGGAAPQVPNPGVYVSTRAEMNLSAACFMARHYRRTTRTLTAADLTTDKVQRYSQFKEAEDAYKEVEDSFKLTKPDKIIDFIDEWPEHLALYDGQNGRPLHYIIRTVVAIPTAGGDPPFGDQNTVYASLRDEVAARADHEALQYSIDNARVFELLNEDVGEHKNVKTWIKPFAQARDGRGAWFAFKAHYRGSSEMEAIEVAAENRLDTLVYRGEKPRYNFETHVSMHRKSHLELEKATGTPIPGPTKVRRLLKSLQTSMMAVPVATIRAQDNLRSDFDETVNYLRSFISTIDQESRNVSQVETKSGPGKKFNKGNSNKNSHYSKKKGKDNDSSMDKSLDRWYKPAEWWKLDQAVRDKIVQARKKRKVSKVVVDQEEESVNNEGDDDDEVPGGSTSQRTSSKTIRFAKGTKKRAVA